MEYYNQKFGPERVAQFLPRLQAAFQVHSVVEAPIANHQHKNVGLELVHKGFTGNTFDAHRLIALAREVGIATI